MTRKSLEEKITSLEKAIKKQAATIKKQQHELERAAAFNECMNLMDKYEYLLPTGHLEEILEMFALKQPDVRAEIANWGVYEGAEALKILYLEIHKDFGKTPGSLVYLPNTNQVFEVAGDGKTAKAVWICPGIETMAPPDGGKPIPHWSWAKRAVDFIKEDGKWKIWHYHVYGVFVTPFDKSWVDAPPPFWTAEARVLPDRLKPTRPTTHPLWIYHPKAVMELVPVPPEPYKKFDEKTAY